MKRAAKIIGILILILLVVAIALPFIVNVNSFRPTIEFQASSGLGRKVTIGNLKLSILTGSVSADDLAIADDPSFGKALFVTAKALSIGVEVIPLVMNKTLHITELTLEQPQITLLRTSLADGTFPAWVPRVRIRPKPKIPPLPNRRAARPISHCRTYLSPS
ncbi:MAG: hypothetical protein DMG88_11040 [Acidobacteria bacterium]|nr:MAG: hypothetical protein DMG88_11040 [Acidobacteriota bacterium]